MTSTTGSGVLEVLPMGDVTSVGGGAATIGDGKGNIDELKVIMGHPDLRALGHVFLPEVMGTSHFTLCQAQDILCNTLNFQNFKTSKLMHFT
jgi:hypothetical protein